MMDNLSYIPLLFNLAEQFFQEGKREAAVMLYEAVAESEQRQHSERLALCQYRLFTLGLSKDQNKNLLLASHFEYFVDRLDEPYQLDALNELINVFASLRRWDKVAELAEKLKIRAMVHYELNGRKKSPEIKKQIIDYIFYAYLILGETHFQFGRYEDALHYVSLYADCDWVQDPDDNEIIVIQKFQEWAEGNRYLYQLMTGKVEVLPEYLKYISTRKNEVFIALCEIVIAANKFGINIDSVLAHYESFLKHQEQQSRTGKISLHYTDDRFVGLLSGLGFYYLKKNDFDRGLRYVLNSLAFAIEIRSGHDMLKCVGLFEQYRDFANEDAQFRYKTLISEVQKLNEKETGFIGRPL
ncbi:transcriptional regulator [Paenibacillus oralis]|uniref:transcriptional regulator n=1 Tax=Paenibacillus oralis TaxID=2490856 RepID=UPI001FE4C461|nr:transcriptional regulator [Paenibacillus oralis]